MFITQLKNKCSGTYSKTRNKCSGTQMSNGPVLLPHQEILPNQSRGVRT